MNKILELLGFIKRTGKLVTGTNAVLRAVLYGKSCMVIVTTDAGDSIKEKFKRLCSENGIKFYITGNKEDFEKATSEENKVIYSITDMGFANKLEQLITKESIDGGAAIGEN